MISFYKANSRPLDFSPHAFSPNDAHMIFFKSARGIHIAFDDTDQGLYFSYIYAYYNMPSTEKCHSRRCYAPRHTTREGQEYAFTCSLLRMQYTITLRRLAFELAPCARGPLRSSAQAGCFYAPPPRRRHRPPARRLAHALRHDIAFRFSMPSGESSLIFAFDFFISRHDAISVSFMTMAMMGLRRGRIAYDIVRMRIDSRF